MGWDEVAVAPLHWLKQVNLDFIDCFFLLNFQSFLKATYFKIELKLF